MLSRGYTFTELLVALLIGAIIVSVAASVSATLIAQNLKLERENTLLEVGQLLTSNLAREIRRSGYISRSVQAHIHSPNPFRAHWQLDAHPAEAPSSCILLAYDKNHDGAVTMSHPNERLGFRLHHQTIEQRVDGRQCDEGWWQDITDDREVRVVRFQVRYQQVFPAHVLVDMELIHASDASLSLTRRITVGLPNH